MKAFIASDLHGSAYWAQRLMDAVAAEQPDRIILLGDLLYHGPRNDLPRDYDPKRVAALLNACAHEGKLVAVRGNCDAEVDQMMLEFPCMADYVQLIVEGQFPTTLFLTHGHAYGPGLDGSSDQVPRLPKNSAILYGHTHEKRNEPCAPDIAQASEAGSCWAFNPGSLALPKDGSHSFGVFDSEKPLDQAFSHVVLEGQAS